ncbi:MAG TPA: MoaD/ThiS family protein [Clostridia bacterium]|nr:MoaD/ThiS family protein [Clostridia bacterium]
MKVKVVIHGHALEFTKGKERERVLDVSPDATVSDVASIIGLPNELFAGFFVNGDKVPPSFRLREGDTVILASPISGGGYQISAGAY